MAFLSGPTNQKTSDPTSFLRRLDHAAQVLAGEDVQVEVGHLLVRVGPVVGEDAVAGRDRAQISGDLADGAEEAGDLLGRGVLREVVEGVTVER